MHKHGDPLPGIWAELGIPPDYGVDPPLPRHLETANLVDVEPNIVGRVQRLTPPTAAAWRRMKRAAFEDAVELLLVSGFRSVGYQIELIRNKLAAGQDIHTILTVNAAPGYSEHHTGRAIDVATPGSRPLTDEFEESSAFAWLCEHAGRFGFRMTYGRGNPYGVRYEPWHWSQIDGTPR
jgi:zinc D-Ala-D-Ala carboxypeptidase